MKLKHKLIKEFQYLGDDKKIIILKVGTILEEYVYKLKSELIPIDKDIVDGNLDFFQMVDWKTELLSYLKSNKIPQPTIISKKLYPFMEELLINNQTIHNDEDMIKDLERKELEIEKREKRVISNEDDNEERLKRIQKREDNYKLDIKELDKRENTLLDKISKLSESEIEVEKKLSYINERERNLESEILNSSQDIEGKYKKFKDKIDNDILFIKNKEKQLIEKEKELLSLKTILDRRESDIEDKIRDYEIMVEETKLWEEELVKLNSEITEWESLHWKFQRNIIPPSCLI